MAKRQRPTRRPPTTPSAESAQSRPPRRRLRRWLTASGAGIGAFAAVGLGAAAGYTAALLKGLPTVTAATFTNLSQPTVVYDVHGQVIGKFAADGDRQPISGIDQVSHQLVNAFIAAEDKTFYQNIGINPLAMARAVVQDLLHHQIESGASTITQQTVKLALFPDQQRTLKRKVQEIALALEVNHLLTKNEIMTDYMNWVYMGKIGDQPVYGVKTASELIFHKDPKDLNLPEAALLAAIPNNPSLFSPYDNLNNALQRQHYILNQMLVNRLITQAEYDAAMRYDIRKDIQPEPKTATLLQHPYLMLDDIRPLVVKYLVDSGRYATADDALKALPTAGYKVYTSIDLNAQQEMEQVLADNTLFGHTDKPALAANGKPLMVDGKPVVDLYEAGMTLIDNETGGILAIGGGRDYQRDSIDHSDVPQQPGSAIKPLLDYGPALDMHQITAATPILDAPVHFTGSNGTIWSPLDDDDQWHGIVTVRQALVESLNVPAIKVLDQIGPAKAGAYLAKMGITTQSRTLNGQPTLDPSDLQHLSTAIGGMRWGLTVQQMTSAYTVFPNQGIYRPAYLISRIADRDGNTVYQYKPTATKVFSPQTAYIMTDILHDVVYRPDGTAYSIGTHFPGEYIAGKTGTTDDHRDGWFIGYTQKYTLGIWMGYNHNQQIDTGPGVNWYNLKFSLWNRVMDPLLKANPPTKPFPEPAGVVRLDVCSKSGQLPTALCAADHDVISEWFIQGTEPTTPCTVHVQALYTVVNGKRYLATTETPPYAIRTGIFLVPPGKLDPGVITPDSSEYLPTQPDPRGGEVLAGEAPEQLPSAPALAAPAGVHADLSASGVHLTWQAVPGATGYTVWRANSPDGPFAHIAGPLNVTSYTDTLALGHAGTVYYQVYATSAAGVSPPSVVASVNLAAPEPGHQAGPANNSAGRVPAAPPRPPAHNRHPALLPEWLWPDTEPAHDSA